MKAHLSCHNLSEYHCFHCIFSGNKLDRFKQHMADMHPEKMMFVGARFYQTDARPIEVSLLLSQKNNRSVKLTTSFTLFQYSKKSSIIILNLAQPIDVPTVRIRECEMNDKMLDSMDPLVLTYSGVAGTSATMNPMNRNLDTRQAMSNHAKVILKEYTMRCSVSPFTTYDDFMTQYLNCDYDDKYVEFEKAQQSKTKLVVQNDSNAK